MSSVSGASGLISALRQFGADAEQMLKDETEAAGRDIEVDAKQRAPVDLGKLRQSINYKSGDNGFKAFVYVNVPYAAYQEFGTGGMVNVPAEMKEIAEYYRGKGIKRVDLKPQPFLYPALVINRELYIKRLTSELTRLTAQFGRR